MKTVIKILLILLICYLGFVVFIMYNAEKAPMLDISSLELNTLENSNYTFKSNRPKIVNIWATWCGPCIKEFPAFQNIYDKYSDQVDFVMISDEPVSKIQKWKTKNDYSFDFVVSDSSFSTRPVTYFIQKDGEIISRKIGGISENKLEEITLDLLKK